LFVFYFKNRGVSTSSINRFLLYAHFNHPIIYIVVQFNRDNKNWIYQLEKYLHIDFPAWKWVIEEA